MLPSHRALPVLAFAAVGVAVTVFVSACAPATAAPQSAPAAPAVSPVPSSAAIPAPTPGGVPPTVVGRVVPSPGVAASVAVASPSAAPAAARVTITSAPAFDPPLVSVSRGQSVQWVNTGRSPQTVTDDPTRVSDPNSAVLPTGAQPWDSGVLNSGQTFTFVFNTPGDYTYTSLPDELQGLIGHITVGS